MREILVRFDSDITRSDRKDDNAWCVVYNVSVMGEFCEESGDGFNEPYYPSHWALFVTVTGMVVTGGEPTWTWPRGTDISSKLTEEEILGLEGQAIQAAERDGNYPY